MTSTNNAVSPKLGDSVFVGFITNGDGKIIKGGALNPFDKIEAIYAETSRNKRGEMLYNVRLGSGDFVTIAASNKNYWQAVA